MSTMTCSIGILEPSFSHEPSVSDATAPPLNSQLVLRSEKPLHEGPESRGPPPFPFESSCLHPHANKNAIIAKRFITVVLPMLRHGRHYLQRPSRPAAP